MRFGRLFQRISSVDDRLEFTCFNQLFDENKIYHFHFKIDPSETGFRRLSVLNDYRIKAFFDWQENRVYGSHIGFEDAELITDPTIIANNERNLGDMSLNNSGYYTTHGNEILIPTTNVSFNINIKLLGAKSDRLKESIQKEFKSFYMALYDRNTEKIYNSMNRLKDSYKNITQEFSYDTTIKKKSYGKIKLHRH